MNQPYTGPRKRDPRIAVIGAGLSGILSAIKLCEVNLEDSVKDLELKRRLTPNYAAMCKRLIMSDRFYPAIQKPNAKLVTSTIERVEPRGVRTSDRVLHELYVLIIATGFESHNFVRPIEVIGENGVSLGDR